VTIAVVTQVRPVANKQQDFQQNQRQILGHLQRMGGGRVHAWQATIAGTSTNIIGIAIDHDDMDALADWVQRSAQDQAWQQQLAAAAAVSTLVARVLYTESGSSGGIQQQPPGGVMLTTLLQPAPGKLAAALEMMGRAHEGWSRAGIQISTWQATIGGPSTGQLLGVAQFPDMKAFVTARGKLDLDRNFQEFRREVQGGATMSIASQSVWTALPTQG
jgi:hypothetical protein